MIKMLVSIFGQITVYKIYTVSREPIRLPKFNIQCLVFNKNCCNTRPMTGRKGPRFMNKPFISGIEKDRCEPH